MSKFFKHFLNSNLERLYLYKSIPIVFKDYSFINKISISYSFNNSNLKMLTGSFLFFKLIFNKIFLFCFNIKNFKVSISLKKGSPSIFYYNIRNKYNYVLIESFFFDLKKIFLKKDINSFQADFFSIKIMVKDLEFLKKKILFILSHYLGIK